MTTAVDQKQWLNSIAEIVSTFSLYMALCMKTVSIDGSLPPPHQSPVELSVHISETKTSDITVANLTKLLLQNGVQMHPISRTPATARFELLDLSANLIKGLHTADRTAFGAVVQVDPIYGIIRFLVSLDRERLCPESHGNTRLCTLHLLLVAYVSEENIIQTSGKESPMGTFGAQTIYIDFSIFIDDINDNLPYFPKLVGVDSGTRIIIVEEECPVGTLVSLPRAIDIDSPEHGVRRYIFHSTATRMEVRSHFEVLTFKDVGIQCEQIKIASNGPVPIDYDHGNYESDTVMPCLHVIHRIDREMMKQFSFRLVAVDSADQQGEITIQVRVKDINDHAPEWASTMVYFDADGRSRTVTASNIQENTDELDTFTSTKIVYEIHIPECTKQKKLIQLKAFDSDDAETPNGQVTYRLSGKTMEAETFRRLFISSDYIYLTGPGLLGLSQSNFSISVIASDGSGSASEAGFVIRVQDCNNHRPIILMRGDVFGVRENLHHTAYLISLITVRDLDLVSSVNSEFQCTINDTNHILLHQVVKCPSTKDNASSHEQPYVTNFNDTVRAASPSGQGRWAIYRLETRPDAPFDREQMATHAVALVCVDNGSPALSSYHLITINVMDENDNAPKFYEKRPKSSYGRIGVWHSSAEPISASDEKSTYEFHVAESTESGSLLGQVHAFDLDSGENARITFEMLTQNITQNVQTNTAALDELFTLSGSGELHLIGKLDREAESQYIFLIIARDYGKPKRQSSTATVIIRVDDINDCHPEFHREYIFEVVESYGSSTMHQILGRLNATDKDLGRNGTVSFRVSTALDYQNQKRKSDQPDGGPFERERFDAKLIQVTHDGQVAIYGVVDRERTPVILFDVIAEDNGVPSRLSTMTTVTIHVLDLNDNKPRFVDPTAFAENKHVSSIRGNEAHHKNVIIPILDPAHMLNISLDTDVGTLLTKFEAVDPDEGPNGTVTFELVNSGASARRSGSKSSNSVDEDIGSELAPMFTLYEDGRLILSRQLDFEELSSNSAKMRYRRPDRLLIRASDGGPSPEHTMIGLHITYHDPVGLKKSQHLLSSTSFQGSLLSPSEPNGISFFPSASLDQRPNRGSEYVSAEFARSRKVMPPRTNGIPMVYLLALAICFALILVITSLIYLYVRMKGPAHPDRTPKLCNNPSLSESNTVKMMNPYENALEDIQQDYSTGGRSTSDNSEHGKTIKSTKAGTLLVSHVNGNRTLSPPYLFVDRYNLLDGDVESNTSFAHQWTNHTADYTELLRPDGNSMLRGSYSPADRLLVNTGIILPHNKEQFSKNGDSSPSERKRMLSCAHPTVGDLVHSNRRTHSADSYTMEQLEENISLQPQTCSQPEDKRLSNRCTSMNEDTCLKEKHDPGYSTITTPLSKTKSKTLQQDCQDPSRLTASFV